MPLVVVVVGRNVVRAGVGHCGGNLSDLDEEGAYVQSRRLEAEAGACRAVDEYLKITVSRTLKERLGGRAERDAEKNVALRRVSFCSNAKNGPRGSLVSDEGEDSTLRQSLEAERLESDRGEREEWGR